MRKIFSAIVISSSLIAFLAACSGATTLSPAEAIQKLQNAGVVCTKPDIMTGPSLACHDNGSSTYIVKFVSDAERPKDGKPLGCNNGNPKRPEWAEGANWYTIIDTMQVNSQQLANALGGSVVTSSSCK